MLQCLLLFVCCLSISSQGWITPEKYGTTKYPFKDKIWITTESTTGSHDEVYFTLHPNTGGYITYITWTFSDWVYDIQWCTPSDYKLKFTTVPPAVVNKTWEITPTGTSLNIKCNGEEVLHFVYDNTYSSDCTTQVKNKTPGKVAFWSYDTATKKFTAKQPTVATPTVSATDDVTSYEIGGTQVTLTCTSTSGGGTYEWKLNGDMISGFTNSYAVPNKDNTTAGDYTCAVTISSVTSAYSSPYTLTASVAAPTISATNDATSYEIGGTQGNLICTSTSGNGTYEWKLNGDMISGVTNSEYAVPNKDNTAAGNYTCAVTISSVTSLYSSLYTLTVSVATPTISLANGPRFYKIGGTQVTLTCTSTSGGGTYEWKLNGDMISGATNSEYAVPNTDNTTAGDYTCAVTISTVTSPYSFPYTLKILG